MNAQTLTIADVAYELSEIDNFAIVTELLSPTATIQPILITGSTSFPVKGIRDSALSTLLDHSLPIPPFLVSITPIPFVGVELSPGGGRLNFYWTDRPPWPRQLTRPIIPSLPSIALAIPDQFERIYAGAFSDWASLTSLHFGPNSEIRELDGFFRCGLTSLSIPDSVQLIGEWAFFGCPSLRSITFGPKSRLRELLGFRRLPILAIALPDSLEVIGRSAFNFCSELIRVEFGSNSHLRVLGGFNYCGFTSFILPDSLEELTFLSFAGCDMLREIICGS
jgi:hypothetical protein